MNKFLYYIDCITNLHVGSGDINFNIVDKEVEKDPTNGYPIIHASGIKGALKDYGEKSQINDAEIKRIFGEPARTDATGKGGSYIFFDANFICRPLRAYGDRANIKVTTIEALKTYIELLSAFGFEINLKTDDLDSISFNEKHFLVSTNTVSSIEDEKVVLIQDDDLIKKIKGIIGDDFAIARNFDDFDLPVIARNNLKIESGGLWYEEYVPRTSRFFFILLTPDENPIIPETLQIGGNNSIGYGFCRFTQVSQGGVENE